MDVIDYSLNGEPVHPLPERTSYGNITVLHDCPHFHAEKLSLKGGTASITTDERFHILLCLGGSVKLHCRGTERLLALGQAVLVPAASGHFDLAPASPSAEIVRVFVP